MNLKIEDIIRCTNGELLIGNNKKECCNFSKDTRTIKNGDTYIGIKGENFDGNELWEEAFENGAETVIINKTKIENIQKYKEQNKNIIQVEDTKEALKQMAIEKRNMYPNLIVVGITGSVGKTSTKDIIANVLCQKYKTLKTEENNNNDIGLPLTILDLKEHEVAVIEMGMSKLGEIRELTKIARPTLSVITNIGTSHIGNLGSRENILKAKLEILEGMDKPIAIINNDNDLLHKWYEENKYDGSISTFGIENESDCMAQKIEKKENSSTFICKFKNENFKVNVPVGGDAFVLNALCASLVGKALNLSVDEIQKGIETFELTKKRLEIINLNNDCTLINDTYNASFESMKASIEYLYNSKAKRKIAVLGDMFELGDFTEDLHRKVGAEIVEKKIDNLFLIGENVKFIKNEAIKLGMKEDNIKYSKTQEELMQILKKEMQRGDLILFKASNGMRLFDVVEKLKLEL